MGDLKCEIHHKNNNACMYPPNLTDPFSNFLQELPTIQPNPVNLPINIALPTRGQVESIKGAWSRIPINPVHGVSIISPGNYYHLKGTEGKYILLLQQRILSGMSHKRLIIA